MYISSLFWPLFSVCISHAHFIHLHPRRDSPPKCRWAIPDQCQRPAWAAGHGTTVFRVRLPAVDDSSYTSHQHRRSASHPLTKKTVAAQAFTVIAASVRHPWVYQHESSTSVQGHHRRAEREREGAAKGRWRQANRGEGEGCVASRGGCPIERGRGEKRRGGGKREGEGETPHLNSCPQRRPTPPSPTLCPPVELHPPPRAPRRPLTPATY